MPRITEARITTGYKIFLRFDDGATGEVNLAHLVGKGVFASWNDQSFFAKVTIDRETGTVVWPGGIDLDPDILHHSITGAPLPGVSEVKAA